MQPRLQVKKRETINRNLGVIVPPQPQQQLQVSAPVYRPGAAQPTPAPSPMRPIDFVKGIVKPFWETADVVRNTGQLGLAALTGNRAAADSAARQISESAGQSIAGGVARAAQYGISNALAPYAERQAQQRQEAARKVLSRSYGPHPAAQAQAEAEAGQAYLEILDAPYNLAGFSYKDSPATQARKVAAIAGEGILDAATAGTAKAATQAGKSVVKSVAKTAALSGAGSALYGAQADNVTAADIAKQFAVGAGTGALLGGAAAGIGKLKNYPWPNRNWVQPEPNVTSPRFASSLQAQKFAKFDDFYKTYKQFFDDQGFDRTQAEGIFQAAQRQPSTVSAPGRGRFGDRPMAEQQAQLELARNTGDAVAAENISRQMDTGLAGGQMDPKVKAELVKAVQAGTPISLQEATARAGVSAASTPITLYRGTGGRIKIAPGANLMGDALYASRDPKIAAKFGDVRKLKAYLNDSEILKITNREEYDNLIKTVIRKYPTGDPMKTIPQYAREQGYKAIDVSEQFDPFGGVAILDESVLKPTVRPVDSAPAKRPYLTTEQPVPKPVTTTNVYGEKVLVGDEPPPVPGRLYGPKNPDKFKQGFIKGAGESPIVEGVENLVKKVRGEGEPAKVAAAEPAPVRPAGTKSGALESIDPSDPFGNRTRFGQLVNTLKTQAGGEDDAQMISLLRKIEKETGRTGLVDQFYVDTGNVRASNSIANAAIRQSEELSTALRGLSKQQLDEFDEYIGARAELKNYVPEGKTTSRGPKELQAIVDRGDAVYGERFEAFNNYYKGLAQTMYDGGLISKDTLQKYLSTDDYVRIQRDMEDLVGRQFGASRARSIGTTTATQKRKGSKRDILPPTQTALKRTQQITLEVQRNAAASNTLDVLAEFGLARNLVDADDVAFRRDMYRFLSDTREGKKLTDRLLKTHSRQMNKLQSEVNKLNKEGLDISLRKDKEVMPKFTPAGLGGTAPTGKRGKVETKFVVGPDGVARGDVGKQIDTLSKQRDAARARADELLGQPAAPNSRGMLPLRGNEEAIASARKANAAQTRINKLVRQTGGDTQFEATKLPKVGPRDTRAFIQSLITEDPTNLRRIKDKLATREPRLAQIIEDVERLRDDSEAFHTARKTAYQAALARSDDSTRNKNTISRFRNGIREVYEVPGDIKQVMDNVNPYQLGVLAKVISFPARLFRAGTTALSAPFTITNYFRDQASSALYSKDVRATHDPKNVFSALASAARDFGTESTDPLWKKFEAVGGDQTIFDDLRNVADSRSMLRELTQGEVGKLKNMALHPIRTLEDLNGITERATRFQNYRGMYKKTLRETGDQKLALRQAILAARQNSADFQRNSAFTRVANLLIPYFNPAVQGSRNVVRSFRDRPVQTTAKSVGFIVLPSIALTAWNYADAERREAYESINEFEKEDNFILVGPNPRQMEDGHWEGVFKIPKPQGYRELTDPARDVAEAFFKGQPVENVGEMFADMMGGLTGPIQTEDLNKFKGSFIPQVVKPWIQLDANRNFYTGKDIVPEYMMDETEDPTERAYEGTSGTARLIAKQLGVSPIQVEQAILDTAGSLGRYGLNASDNALATVGGIPREQIGGRSAWGDIKRRTVEASGQLLDANKSAGRLYYEDRAQALENVKLNKNERDAFNAINPSRKDFIGDPLNDKTYYDGAHKSLTYQRYPRVFEAAREVDRLQRERGKPGDPLFDLNPTQQKTILNMQQLGSTPGNREVDAIMELNPWIKDFYAKRSEFFDNIKATQTPEEQAKSGVDPQGMKMPIADEVIKQKLDSLNTITDPATRAKFYSANPDVLDFFADQDTYQRAKRAFMGLPQLDPYPEAPKDVQKVLDQYSSLPKGEGPGGKSPTRSAWIKSHPSEWAKMTEYFNIKSQYDLAQAGSLAVYEGIGFDKDDYKDILSLAQGGGKSFGSGGGGGGGFNPYSAKFTSGTAVGSAPRPTVKASGGGRKVAVKARKKVAPKVTSVKLRG